MEYAAIEHDLPVSLEVEGVAAGYGARMVLRDVSFRLERRQALVISGPNGSGKSTLIRALCGLQRPLAGVIRYHCGGTALDPRDATQLIGWVAPDLALYRELSAVENLEFFARVRGRQVARVQLDALLAWLGLGGRGDDRVASYSSGMLHRLRYAYALLHAPPVLLLDEPTVTLDARGAAVVERVIERQRAHGIVVIATNDPRELRYGDFVLTIN